MAWSSIPASIIPHRLRRKFRSTRSKLRSHVTPSSTITTLQSSFDPARTIASLRAHQWSFFDGQYLLLALIGIFSLSVMQTPEPMVKTAIATLLIISLIFPITRQFFLPLLPIIGWLVFYFSCQFIPAEYRPPIWVRVLPTLESVFYGANISNILSAPAKNHHTILDILGWLPYGITHFGAPFVVSIFMFIFGPPGMLPIFARTFGYMNLTGVMIQMTFPCSPPWYENMYGLAPANYSIKGSPAGLAAIDRLFGIDLYTSTFTASPLVFGAFPSLHAGCATTEALFMSHLFPRLKPLFIAYVLWLWWATMYLSHHYAVDLVGGSMLAGVCFFIAKSGFVPRLQPGKMFRWDYDFVEVGEDDPAATAPGGARYSVVDNGYGYGFDDTHAAHARGHASESDAWSLGSTSTSPARSISLSMRSAGVDESPARLAPETSVYGAGAAEVGHAGGHHAGGHAGGHAHAIAGTSVWDGETVAGSGASHSSGSER